MSRKKKILQAHQTRILLEDMSQSWVGVGAYRNLVSLPQNRLHPLEGDWASPYQQPCTFGECGYFPGGVGGTNTRLFLSHIYKQMENFPGAREVSGQVQAC